METSLRPARDTQRIRVYRANTGVLGSPLPRMEDIHDFASSVVSSATWKTLFPSPDVWRVPTLKPGKGARTAHVIWHHDGRIEIAFPKAYRYTTYVLHEFAHFGLGLDSSIAAHGPEFVGAWMTLVREFCSARTVNALEKGLARERVKFHIPILDIRDDSESLQSHDPQFVYDEDSNTVIIKGSATYIDIDQLQLFG